MLPVSLLSLFLPALAAAASDKCYRRDGTEWTPELSSRLGTPQVYPCNPEAPVSHCCRSQDFCLSNGLCINAEDDNWYTIQGCTTEVWEGPCVNEFQNDEGSEQVVIHLWACEFKANKDVIYCLGESNCCGHNGASTVLLPRWSDVYRPGAMSTSQPNTEDTGAGPGETEPSSSSPSSSSSSNNQNTTKIALGVGIGVGACLIASILFLALQVRRKNASHEKLERVLLSIGDVSNVVRNPVYPPVELETPPAELFSSASPGSPKKSPKDFVTPVKSLFSPTNKF